MAGVSNDAIIDFFEKETDDKDLKDNFVGVFPSNFVIRFISFHEMMCFDLIKMVHTGGVF